MSSFCIFDKLCFSRTTLCTYPPEHRSIIFTSDVQKISRFGFSLALHTIFKYKIIFKIEMEIKDLSWNNEKTTRFNNPLLSRSIRGLIVGKSASGKTTMLLNLLLNPGWLDYDNL